MDSKVNDSGIMTPIGTGSIDNIALEEDKTLASRITHKIDMRMIPMLCALYLMAYLDRTNIANAKLLGLKVELHMPSKGITQRFGYSL